MNMSLRWRARAVLSHSASNLGRTTRGRPNAATTGLTSRAKAVAITLIAQLEGMSLLWAIAPELVPLTDQSETAIGLLLHGLMVEQI